MSRNIAAVVLFAGVLSLPGSVQAGGPRYDDYYYGGGYYGGYHPPYPPGASVTSRSSSSSADPSAAAVRTAGLWLGLYSPSASPKPRPISLLGWRPLCRRALYATICGPEMVRMPPRPVSA